MAISQPRKQINPTDGLIAYVQAIKPYHSKIVDVLIEYVATDVASTTVKDKMSLTIIDDNTGEPKDVLFTCGFGDVWDPYSQAEADTTAVQLLSVQGYPINKIVVKYTAPPPEKAVVSNTKANQLTLVNRYAIIGTNPIDQRWIVQGDASGVISPQQHVYVSSNAPTTNGKYTVNAVTYDSAQNRTFVTTVEPISLLATVNGSLNVAKTFAELPRWVSALALQPYSTTTLPSKIESKLYYFNPTSTPGVFNLALTRYPQAYGDVVDINQVGTGDLTIQRMQPFVPGQPVVISGTGNPNVDQKWVIGDINQLTDDTFEIDIYGNVYDSIPSTGAAIGSVQLDGTWGSPACPPAIVPDMLAFTNVRERVIFQFDPGTSTPPIVIV